MVTLYHSGGRGIGYAYAKHPTDTQATQSGDINKQNNILLQLWARELKEGELWKGGFVHLDIVVIN